MRQEGTLEETWGRGSNVCNSEERKSSSVQSLSRVRLFVTPRTAAHQASLSITNSQSLLKLMSIKSVMPSNRLILCRPLLLPPIFPSIRVFSKSQFSTSGGQRTGQRTGVSALASVLPKQKQIGVAVFQKALAIKAPPTPSLWDSA